MKILDNGNVELTKFVGGKPSGETVVVSPFDLGKYGVPYEKYLSELKAWQAIKTGQTAGGAIDPNMVNTTPLKAEPQPSWDEQQKQANLSAMSGDIAGQKTLKEVTQKYVPKGISQYDILNTYNTTSPYGPAKETPEQLSGEMGYSGDVLKKIYPEKFAAKAASEAIAQQIGSNVVNEINKVSPDVRNLSGTDKAFKVKTTLSLPFNVGRYLLKGNEAMKLADLDSKYFILTQAVVKAMQGTRPSDYDVRSYQKSIAPSIEFSDEVNQMRIKNMLNLMGKQMNGQNVMLDQATISNEDLIKSAGGN